MERRNHKERNRTLDLGTMIYGKIPPQARPLEQAILGAVLINKDSFDTVTEILKPECFYVEAHQRIFSAMQSLVLKNQPIDILTVSEELRFKEELEIVGGPYYITQLTNNVVSSSHIEAHCQIVLQKYIQREIIRVGGEMVQDGYEDAIDVFDLLSQTEENIFKISFTNMRSDYTSMDAAVIEVIRKLQKLRSSDKRLTGIDTGFHELNKITMGWQPSDLIIIAARPSVGKTAFALNLARNAFFGEHKTPVGIFSLEMSKSQLTQRMLSTESGIWLSSLNSGRVDEDHMKTLYHKGVQKIGTASIYIDDTAAINMFELRAKVKRMIHKNKVGLVVIDYLQLMTGDTNKSDNREREISKISRELKKMAKDFEVPVIALSQLSRKIEERTDKEPLLSDLRESGAIEQDADIVLFIYGPSKKDIEQDAELRNRKIIKIAKHRNGNLGEIVFNFYGETQKWEEVGSPAPIVGTWKPVSEDPNNK